MQSPYNMSDAIRYLYPAAVFPLLRTIETDTKNPFDINPVFGAIDFDFLRVFEFRIGEDEIVDYHLADPETYYWGLELSADEISSFAGFPDITEFSDAERFALTVWGGYIPLRDNEIVIPYPEFQELPADMRLN
jgi:hypothetical protein